MVTSSKLTIDNYDVVPLQIVSSAPEPVLTADFVPVDHLAPFATVTASAAGVDDTGQHFYVLENGQLLAKRHTVVLTEAAHVDPAAPIVLLDAENINQYTWGMPNGCEPAALLEGLHLKGRELAKDYAAFIREMPISPNYNPYEGFGGDPATNVPGHFEAIFPEPLTQWASRYANVTDISGSSIAELKTYVNQKNPVVAYVTVGFETPEWGDYSFGRALANNHAVLVDGWAGTLIHVSDPIDGQYWLPEAKFAQAYDARHWAVLLD